VQLLLIPNSQVSRAQAHFQNDQILPNSKKRKKMRLVYFVGGYSNSGKSTLLNQLQKDYFCEVVSGSKFLHQKHVELFGHDSNCKTTAGRKKFIKWAEGEYIPGLGGRSEFVAQLMGKAINSSADVVLVESIGGEEFDLMMGDLPWATPYGTYNCTRIGEKPGVDIRKLLPDAIELDCNFAWSPADVSQYFPDLVPRNLLPIPDCIARELGYSFFGSVLEKTSIRCLETGHSFEVEPELSLQIIDGLIACGTSKYPWADGFLHTNKKGNLLLSNCAPEFQSLNMFINYQKARHYYV
jgi:hypothetical protein